MTHEKTARGFSTYGKFADSNGSRVYAVESSEMGPPRCRVYVKNANGWPLAAHLTVEEAEKLKGLLDRFIEDAKRAQ